MPGLLSFVDLYLVGCRGETWIIKQMNKDLMRDSLHDNQPCFSCEIKYLNKVLPTQLPTCAIIKLSG